LVLGFICFVLIESHKDESLVSIKIGIVEQRSQETSSPVSGVIDGCIVTIVQHVGSDKGPDINEGLYVRIPLRKLVIFQVIIK